MRAPDQAQDLLLMARKDFDALRGMLDNPLFADEIVGFHAQQAIEKALKAWLAARSVSFPLTHDLSRLLGLLEENGNDVSVLATRSIHGLRCAGPLRSWTDGDRGADRPQCRDRGGAAVARHRRSIDRGERGRNARAGQAVTEPGSGLVTEEERMKGLTVSLSPAPSSASGRGGRR